MNLWVVAPYHPVHFGGFVKVQIQHFLFFTRLLYLVTIVGDEPFLLAITLSLFVAMDLIEKEM